MTQVTYRQPLETEIEETAGVFLEAVADLYARHGLPGAALPERPFIEKMYEYIRRTGIFRVAESEGRIVAVCHAVVRDSLWFLSGFWALPALQRQRIGMPLLREVWEEGARAGARTFFTWSSVDTTAMAAYMKMEMLPGYQILTFAGAPRVTPPPLDVYETRPLDVAAAVSIDERVRATGREVDHRLWLSDADYTGRLVLGRGGRVAGYYYFQQSGVVGPAAWDAAEDAEGLLSAAFREASARSGGQVRLALPGINHAGIRFSLASGLRLLAYTHLLTTAPFGRMECYVPSGPSLF
ncbi:MAG TPA: GNAT family N-acetyltransferase [Pyrinomonadaceae bacterium]